MTHDEHGTNPTAHSTPVRLLIVDDSDDQRGLLRRYFERAGCEVVTAGTAEEAIAAYSAAPLDTQDYPQTQAVLPKPVRRADVRAVLEACVPRWVAP